ncbi:MAG: hypothetical protein EAY81_10195, partial [Bacteroidetes bacterium]
EVFLYLSLASVISFAGSIQPGPVNMAVVFTALNNQFKRARYVALGGSVPELLASYVAMRFSLVIMDYENVIDQFSFGFSFVFIALGVVLIISKNANKLKQQNGSKSGFVLGFLLGLLNPQLILFWFGAITWLGIKGFQFHNHVLQYTFIVGTGVGAFLLHILLLYLIQLNHNSIWVKRLNLYGNKIIGVIFILLGIVNFIL